MVNSLYLWCTSKCHLVPIDMFIRVGPISPKCSRRLFRRGARLESKRVQVFLDGATSHEPPTRLRFELESKQDFCCRRNQERDFCTAKNKWGTFFYQDSFKEPPGFWGLQMLVSVKVQPPSDWSRNNNISHFCPLSLHFWDPYPYSIGRNITVLVLVLSLLTTNVGVRAAHIRSSRAEPAGTFTWLLHHAAA